MQNKVYCNCCGKQFVSGQVSKLDEYTTSSENVVYVVNGFICKYCAEDLDEYGMFPEERSFGI